VMIETEGDQWLVNVLVPLDGGAKRLLTKRLCVAADGTPAEVLEFARFRWPGKVLDAVGPDGRSFLLCSVPPWEEAGALKPPPTGG